MRKGVTDAASDGCVLQTWRRVFAEEGRGWALCVCEISPGWAQATHMCGESGVEVLYRWTDGVPWIL